MYAWSPASLRAWMAPSGRPAMSPDPAPCGSSVTSAGMSKTTQCQKPLPVGASGSNTVTAKLLVSGGKPSHRRWGDVLPPSSPKRASATCSLSSVFPSATSSLVTVNDGTGAT